MENTEEEKTGILLRENRVYLLPGNRVFLENGQECYDERSKENRRKQLFHKDNQTIVEWHFKNKMNEEKVDKVIKEFTTAINNPQKMYPPLYLLPVVFDIDEKKVNWF